MNLLTETLEAIKNSGHAQTDVIFIGSEESGRCCSLDQFKILADQEYDDGFGGQEVARDLVIVFSDGAKMWRGENDGSEWWNFSTPFVKPANTKPIDNLFTGCSSLADQNPDETNSEIIDGGFTMQGVHLYDRDGKEFDSVPASQPQLEGGA
jgi:hypothetical protein